MHTRDYFNKNTVTNARCTKINQFLLSITLIVKCNIQKAIKGLYRIQNSEFLRCNSKSQRCLPSSEDFYSGKRQKLCCSDLMRQ